MKDSKWYKILKKKSSLLFRIHHYCCSKNQRKKFGSEATIGFLLPLCSRMHKTSDRIMTVYTFVFKIYYQTGACKFTYMRSRIINFCWITIVFFLSSVYCFYCPRFIFFLKFLPCLKQ